MTVMTYNIKNHHPHPEHEWRDRLPLLLDVVRRHDPDLLCVQEAFAEQMADLRVGLPDHVDVGQGREGGTAGEHASIFVRRDRLAVEEDGAFWLSDTPDVVGSNTWGTSHVRMATWGRFRERESDVAFVVLNTHVAHEQNAFGASVRLRSAELIIRRLADVDVPVIVTGDFNEGAGLGAASGPFADAGFVDAWTVAGDADPTSSFNGWAPPAAAGVRIDWVLTRGPVAVESVRIDHDDPTTWAASDHFPVVVCLRLEPAEPAPVGAPARSETTL